MQQTLIDPSMISPFKMIFIPVITQQQNDPQQRFFRSIRRGHVLNAWDVIPGKIVYQITKPSGVTNYTFVTDSDDPLHLFTLLYHSGNFDTTFEDKYFVRELHKEMLGYEYDQDQIMQRDFDLHENLIFYNLSGPDVLAKLYFQNAVEGGLICGDFITTYERVGR